MKKLCTYCGSDDQVVSTEDGDFCRECYRIYKRGRSQGQPVEQDQDRHPLDT